MRDRYLKTILPNVDAYNLPSRQKEMLKSVAIRSSKEDDGMAFMIHVKIRVK